MSVHTANSTPEPVTRPIIVEATSSPADHKQTNK